MRIDLTNGMTITPGADHRTFSANWRNTMEWADHTLVWGLDWWMWKYDGTRKFYNPSGVQVNEDQPLSDSNQYSGGIFVEDDWQLTETLTLNVGGRIDRIVAETEDNAGDPSGLAVEATFHDISWPRTPVSPGSSAPNGAARCCWPLAIARRTCSTASSSSPWARALSLRESGSRPRAQPVP